MVSRSIVGSGITLLLLAGACTPGATKQSTDSQAQVAQTPAANAQANAAPEAQNANAKVAPTPTLTAATVPGAPSTADQLAAFYKQNMPENGVYENGQVAHTIQKGDTYQKIATAYLNMTDVYAATDLAHIMEKTKVAMAPGNKVTIPNLLTRVPGDPKAERLGWPEDKILRGIFVTGIAGQRAWQDYLDRLAERGLNAIVLDGRDYQGPITYPTKAKLAHESGTYAKPPIPDLARAIRFAHQKGIRVIMRIPCFHDPWTDKAVPRVTLKGPAGNPVHFEWLDPTNEEVQSYVLDLVKEQVDAGADEIQLDYVRFPVHLGEMAAKMPKQKDRAGVIRDFVKRVHDVTEPAGVKLSLDLFGVAATGNRDDIEKLGQDIAIVGPAAEAISPMAYPSHYTKGYMGWEIPGDHPEIIGIANKAAVAQLEKVKSTTVVRAWLQAFPWRSPKFGPKYIADQAKEAEKSGGHGWLMWSPDGSYGAVWQAIPKLAQTK